MFNKKVQVKFTEHGTHNLFGMIWPGRVITTNKSIAEKLIRQDIAEWPSKEAEDVTVDGPAFSSKKVADYVAELNEAGNLSTAQIAKIEATGKGDKITKGDVDAFLETLESNDDNDSGDETE